MDVSFSTRMQKEVLFLFPGEMVVAPGKELVRTLDGPCLTLAIIDPVAHVGGMYSFLFQKPSTSEQEQQAWFLALGEMELFFQDYVKLGGRRDRSKAVICGGMISGVSKNIQQNIEYTHELLRRYLVSEQVVIRREYADKPYRSMITLDPERAVISARKFRKPAIPEIFLLHEKDYLGNPPRMRACAGDLQVFD